jgi:isopentenyl-diphosphate delta-isomerase
MLMKTVTEFVVLVDEQDNRTGIMEKSRVHTQHTPLHRAFSLFLFNKNRQLLLQRRAGSKPTWPLVWSNSCCGHPLPGESYEKAVLRRTRFELGILPDHLLKVSHFRYCFSKDGIMENEICPIFAGFYDGPIWANRDEIDSVTWIDWADWVKEVCFSPKSYSPWCVEETRIMEQLSHWKSHIRQIIATAA